MIYDKIENLRKYEHLNENFKEAFDFLENFSSLSVGKHEINDNSFILVKDYEPKDFAMVSGESHNDYIDIQMILSGKEKMGFSFRDTAVVTTPYNKEKDGTVYEKNSENFVTVSSGEFVMFFPYDVHTPEIKVCQGNVKKCIIKVRV